MWSNALDSDVVKWFVNLGIELIKVVDTLGLIPSILLSIASFKILKSLFSGTDIVGFIKSIGALTMGTKVFEAETRKASFALIAETINTKLAGSALVEYAIKMKLASAADVAKMTTTQLLGLSFKALGVAIWDAVKAIAAFLFTNPVGWIILAIGAIAGGIAIFNHFHKTTEELIEELNELKSELQDIQSELDSVNSELETTNNRMAELLAKDKLSFTEKEELNNLKKQNDELQRRIDLLDLEKKQKLKKTASTFVETMESDLNDFGEYNVAYGKRTFLWKLYEAFLNGAPADDIVSESEYIDYEFEKYEELLKKKQDIENQIRNAGGEDTDDGKKFAEQKKQIDQQIDEIETYMNGKKDEFEKNAEGLEYGIDPETDKWLDFIYNYQDKWAIASGGTNAKPNAITRILNKESYAEISDAIDGYVEALKNGDESAKEKIDSIIRGNADLVADLQASGIKINDEINEAADHFTSFVSDANYATLEGKIEEVSEAATNFEKLLKGGLFKVDGVDTGLADLFDEEGKIIQRKLSQVFQDTSDQTRAEITRLLESSYDMIADGLDDSKINYLMNRMGLSFSRAILEIEKNNIANKNLELFPGLEDEISGIIDTFSELTSAVGSVVDAMDTLDKARAEEEYSGSVSLETLEALMQSTDNYADLIEVDETGAIRLATNAQEILVAQKIEAIKQNAALALEEAELAYQEALHTEQTYSQTGPAQDFMRGLWNEVGGAMAFVTSLWSDLTSGNWDGAWDRAKTARENSITQKETNYANKVAAASVAVAEAAKQVENAEKMNNIAQGLTSENIKQRHSSEEASGGADNPEEVKENKLKAMMDAFQAAMDYWENRIATNQSKYEQLQNEIDLMEKKGQKSDASYYEEQIKLENEHRWLLEQQKKEAQAYLDQIISAGNEGSDEFWEVANTLNDIESELDDVTASIVDLQDAIAEIDTYKFEEFNTRLDNLVSKLDTIGDLIAPNGEEDWFDDNGDWTEAGVAVLGKNLQKLELYKQGYQNAIDELVNYQPEYEGNESYYEALGIHSEQEWYDKTSELIDQQYDFAESISDTEQSIVDMYESNIDAVEEYINTLVDGYNDYIDSVKKALDAERDYTLWKQSYSPLYMETYIMYSFELLENP